MFYITEETQERGKEVPEFITSEFSDVVTNKSPERLPEFKNITHRIHLIPGAKPTARSPYRMSQFETDELKKQGRLPQVPNAYSPFSVETQSTRAKDLAIKLKAIHTRTQDLIVEAQAEQERFANRTRERINYEVGEWILLNRDAYLNHTLYYKMQPVYFGPYRIVAQSGELLKWIFQLLQRNTELSIRSGSVNSMKDQNLTQNNHQKRI